MTARAAEERVITLTLAISPDAMFLLRYRNEYATVPARTPAAKEFEARQPLPPALQDATSRAVFFFGADVGEVDDGWLRRTCPDPVPTALTHLPWIVVSQFNDQVLKRGKSVAVAGDDATGVGDYRGRITYEKDAPFENTTLPWLRGEFTFSAAPWLEFPIASDMTLRRTAKVEWEAMYDPASHAMLSFQSRLRSESTILHQESDIGGIHHWPDMWKQPGLLILTAAGEGCVAPVMPVSEPAVALAVRNGGNCLAEAVGEEIKKAMRPLRRPANPTYALQECLLGAYAALQAGIAADHPGILAVIETTLQPQPWIIDYNTYVPALVLMLGDAWLSALERLPEASRAAHREPEQRVRGMLPTVVNALLAKSSSNNGWGSPDLSNTQYGILGLHAAVHAGVFTRETHPEFDAHWKSIVLRLLAVQQTEGPEVVLRSPLPGMESPPAKASARGWGYLMNGPQSDAYPCMTVTALGSLTIAWQYLAPSLAEDEHAVLRQQVMRALLDGLAWMQDRFTVWGARDRFDLHWYYSLYAVERAGVLLDIPRFGDHDWFVEGAQMLLATQQDNGQWRNGIVDTAFCVLFLQRATAKVVSPPAAPR